MEYFKKRKYQPIIGILLLFLCASIGFSSEWKLYPGAKRDDKATQQSQEMARAAKMTNVRSTVYTTSDSLYRCLLAH